MVRITIDRELVAKLLSTDEAVELCDESGKLVARAEPLSQKNEDPRSLFPELTAEEIDRRCNKPGPWLTTEELLQGLRELS